MSTWPRKMQFVVLILAGVCAWFGPKSAAAADPYVLQQGDVLELVVSGTPEVRERMPISTDGTVIAPLLGVLPAAGRTLEAVRAEARDVLSRLSVPIVGDGGAAYSLRIHPSLVSVTVLEYRAIFVDGDVASPGSYPFTPGLTVRQAIALAGGFGLGARNWNPKLDYLERFGQMMSLAARRDTLNARSERLEVEIAGTIVNFVDGDEETNTLPPGIEAEHLLMRREQIAEAEAYFEAASAHTEAELVSLREQLDSEVRGEDADRAELERLAEAKEQGTITASRLNDQRRRLFFSTANRASTQANISQTKRLLERLRADFEQEKLRMQDAAFKELRDTELQLAETAAQLEGVQRTMLYLSGLPSEMRDDVRVAIRVLHPDGSIIMVTQDQDAEMRPGTIVTVEVRFGFEESG